MVVIAAAGYPTVGPDSSPRDPSMYRSHVLTGS